MLDFQLAANLNNLQGTKNITKTGNGSLVPYLQLEFPMQSESWTEALVFK